jgi:predicted NodU family carbamoyl transferase
MPADPIILGISAYHADAATCLVRGDELVAAAEEERFRRAKHWAGFPSQAIGYCLREAKLDLGDVTHVAVNRGARANFFRKLGHVLASRPSPRLLAAKLKNRREVERIDDELGAHARSGAIRYERRDKIPAVTHVDGAGRLQTVERGANPRFHALIAAFRELTGVPMLLNTSFNENEPVVCRPEEALDCFLRTNIDVLVLGGYWLRRLPAAC